MKSGGMRENTEERSAVVAAALAGDRPQRKPQFRERPNGGETTLLLRAALPFLLFWMLWSVPLVSLGMGVLGTERASFVAAVAAAGTTVVLFGQLSRRHSALYILPVSRKSMANWLWLIGCMFPILIMLLTWLLAHFVSLRASGQTAPWSLDATLLLALPMTISLAFLPWLLVLTRWLGHRIYGNLSSIGGLVLFGYQVSVAGWPLTHEIQLRWSSLLFFPLAVLMGTTAFASGSFLRRERLLNAIYQRFVERDGAHAKSGPQRRQFQSTGHVLVSTGLRLYKYILLIPAGFVLMEALWLLFSTAGKPVIWSVEIYMLCVAILACAFMGTFYSTVEAFRQWRALASLPLDARQRVRLMEMGWVVLLFPAALCAAFSELLLVGRIKDFQWIIATYLLLPAALGPLLLAQHFWRPRCWWLFVLLVLMVMSPVPYLPNPGRLLLIVLVWFGGHAWFRYSVAHQGKPDPTSLRLWGVAPDLRS